MKFAICSLLLCLASFVESQCIFCHSMDEALVEPERVQYLDLSAQGLTEIPKRINELINLETLDLSDNMIVEWNEPIELPELKHLNFSNNPGIIALELKGVGESLPKLEHLDLSSCSIRFFTPYWGELRNLNTLDISNNALRYIPDELAEIPGLEKLDVSNNDLQNVHWMRNLWSIQYLDITGNPELPLSDVALSLVCKNELKKVTLTPDETETLPRLFSDVHVEEIVLKGGSIEKMNNRVCRNRSIHKLTIEGVSIENPIGFYSWVNRFEELKTLQLQDMYVPRGLKELRSDLKKIHFVRADIENKNELRSVNPRIILSAENTGIHSEGYIGNAQIATLSNEFRGEILPQIMSDEMIENRVESFVEPKTVEILMDARFSRKVDLGFSRYDIPSEAFLTQEGTMYSGKVRIRVQEYNDPVVMALSGAPMTYRTENGDQQFSSSGMIDFRAYDDEGNELQPNPANEIRVTLKDIQPSEQSNLYVFNERSSNWEQIGVPDNTNYDERRARLIDSICGLSPEEVVGFSVVPLALEMKYTRHRYDPYSLNFSRLTFPRNLKRMPKKFKETLYTGNSDQRWIAECQDWKIDTLISDQTKAFLKTMRSEQRKAQRYWKKRQNRRTELAPRLIRNLRIEPDFTNDNYRMTFHYKDTVVRLPVVASLTGSPARIQMKEQRNWKRYELQKKWAKKEQDMLERYKEHVVKNQAVIEREKMKHVIDAELMQGRVRRRIGREVLSFGLGMFGLINCDFINTSPRPTKYVLADERAIDEDGNYVDLPQDIRHVALDGNTYYTTTSRAIPEKPAKRSVIFFMVSAMEVAVVQGWKRMGDGLACLKIKRISIEGLTPDQASQQIRDAGT